MDEEVRRLRCELRDMRNRFAEEGARLNAEVAFWKLQFFQACALIPEHDLPVAYEVEGIRLEAIDGRGVVPREDAPHVALVHRHR